MISSAKHKPEDHWSYIAHLNAEDMLKSAVSEEKKFKKSLWSLILCNFFHDFIHVYSPGAGADNPLGTVISCKFQKNVFEVWFYTIFFMILYMCIASGQGQTAPPGTTPWGWSFDVNRSLLSLWSFVASFKPEDQWSCIAHLSAEDMLKSVVIEENKFKHSPREGADNPLGPKFWCQQEGLITMVICCKFKKESLQLLTSYTSLHDLINVYSRRSGADNPREQNFDVNRNLLSLRSFATSFKKTLFKVWFYTIFYMILYMYIAPGQGLITPWGRNFDVKRNILSLRSLVASFKKMSLKSNFIQFFSWFYTCV